MNKFNKILKKSFNLHLKNVDSGNAPKQSTWEQNSGSSSNSHGSTAYWHLCPVNFGGHVQAHVNTSKIPPFKHDWHIGLVGHRHLFGP